MEAITEAIRQAALAGRLREYCRKNGETGLGGLLRLAERHSAAVTAALAPVGQRAYGGGRLEAAPVAVRGLGAGERTHTREW